MATYKVIQDIEAEDKLVGPFSLRQFIYAGIAGLLTYLSVLSVMKGAAFLLTLFVPPILFCMFFAWPWSPDQPTEVWALARIRFYFKPRRRIWDQTGIKDLVTITAPKRAQRIYTNGLSQTEVQSRLSALANTIDSRGWVIKNAATNLSNGAGMQGIQSDRLIDLSSMPQEVSNLDIQASDDILDEVNNPIAQQFDQLINASSKAHRQQIVERLKETAPAQPAADYWFMNQTPTATTASNNVVFATPQVVQPGAPTPVGPVAATPTADEEALAASIKQHATPAAQSYGHLKNIQPITPGQPAAPAVAPPVAKAPAAPVPSQPDTAILNLANNNDLNVATLAREAHKAHKPELPPDGEVVISLH